MSSDVPQTLLDVLAVQFPASSRTTLRQWLADERVAVNGRVERIAKREIKSADRVELLPRRRGPEPVWPLPVVYQDEDLLVIDKPAGLLTSTVPREKRPTAIAKLREHVARVLPRAYVSLVHRLDRDASGLLVFSLSQPAFAALKSQFADRTAGRVYHAVVAGVPKAASGMIDFPLAEHADGTVHRSTHPRYAQSAITHYKVLSKAKHRSLLRVNLETGRKHQIRAHLAGIGHPIVGDAVYGGPPADRLMLAAVELSLEYPPGERRTFQIDPPPALAAAINA